MDTSDKLTTVQTAKRIGCSVQSVYVFTMVGRLTPEKMYNRNFFPVSQVDEFKKTYNNGRYNETQKQSN